MQLASTFIYKSLSSFRNKFHYFLNLIRWKDWQDVRIPFVFVILLYFQYTNQILGSGLGAYQRFFTLILFSFCYYIFLFVSNDLCDFRQDVQSGKKTGYRSKLFMIAIIVTVFFSGLYLLIVSWPGITTWNILITAIGYILAFFYSAPPFRFKEQGFWGIIVGSLVLRTICILLAITGSLKIVGLTNLIIYLVWVTIFGIRTMLFHQLDDFDNDMRSHVKTYTTHHGVLLAKKFTSRYVIPAEYLCLVVLIYRFIITIPIIGYGLVFALMFTTIRHILHHTLSVQSISHYRPILGIVIFFYLPVALAAMISIRDQLWFIFFFVLYWQRKYFSNPFKINRQ